jgi:hypothetical protein
MKIAENPLQFVTTLRFFALAPTGHLANADRCWFVLLEYDLDQIFCQPLIGLWLLGTRWSGASVVNPIRHLFQTFYFYFVQITVSIGLITGASDRSWFLLEDATNFKIFWTSNSLTPHIRVRIVRAVETENYLFLGKRIIIPLPATHIKLVTIVLIAFRLFSLLPSHLSLSSPFITQWLTPLFMPLLPPLFRQPAPKTRGMTLGQKAMRWLLLFLQLVVPQDWRRGRFQNSPTSLRRRLWPKMTAGHTTIVDGW